MILEIAVTLIKPMINQKESRRCLKGKDATEDVVNSWKTKN